MSSRGQGAGRVEVPEATVVFTVKLPARLAAAVREHARECGRTISAVCHAGAGGVLGAGPQKPSPQVSDRPVGTESVFGRHAAAESSVAYAILVPQRQARIARPGQEGRGPMTSAAIYARVSSARQKKDETIGSQTAALREHAAQSRLDVPEEWVFEDEGHSGATLVRPALEALRDLVAQGCLDVVLCYSPDRLARKFAYQALLLEEFARAGVRVEFVKNGTRGDTPEDQLLVQFQGMFAEYEKAQLMERYRRGKAHRARTGSVNVLSGAPFGYRYIRKTDLCRCRLRDHRGRGGAGRGDVPPLRRRRRLHRRPGPLADRPGRAHPDRQAPLGPRRGLGMLATPPTRAPRCSARPWPCTRPPG